MKTKIPVEVRELQKMSRLKSLKAMDETEVFLLARRVYVKAKQLIADGDYDNEIGIIVGDAFARVYLYTLLRKEELKGQPLIDVLPLVRVAAKESMPAGGVVNAIGVHYDGLPRVPFPEGWVPGERER